MTHGTDEPIAIQCIKCIADSLPTSLRSIDSHPRSLLKNGELDRRRPAPAAQGLRPDVQVGSPCAGRLVFQVQGVRAVPRLNVSDDVPAESPADCARLCWASGCKTAGYIPNPAKRGGVCLLSQDAELCAVNSPLLPQVSESSPVLLSCLHCTGCDYRVRRGVPTSALPAFNVQTSARDVADCAAECGRRGCSAAAFSARSPQGNCLLATAASSSGCAAAERREEFLLDTDSNAPLILDCLACGL